MFRIAKTFTFSASHQLLGLPDDHPCSRLHGHNYRVTLTLECRSNDLDLVSMVYDYRKLDPFKQYLNEEVDHQHLNDLFHSTTAEALAMEFYMRAVRLLPLPPTVRLMVVTVSETPNTTAEYHPALPGE